MSCRKAEVLCGGKGSPRVRYQKLRPEGALLQLAQKVALPRVPSPRKLCYRKVLSFLLHKFHDNWLFSARTGYWLPDCSFPDSDFKFPEVIKGASRVIYEPVLERWQNVLKKIFFT
jgi:hypothetical protein